MTEKLNNLEKKEKMFCALQKLIKRGNCDVDLIKEILFEAGGCDFTNKTGWTPLMLASFYGNTPVVRFLLDIGANPSIQNKFGETAAKLALYKNHKKVIEIIRNKDG